jgi:hypothetical protein
MTVSRLCALARSVSLSALVLAATVGGAGAQQPTQAQANAIRQSCRDDYQAHCANVPTGGAAALQCLQGNLASLSPGCQAAVSATEGGTASNPPSTTSQGGTAPMPGAPPALSPREEAALLRRSCAGDFRTFCRSVSLGGGRALACLADHQESISAPCRDALATMRGR